MTTQADLSVSFGNDAALRHIVELGCRAPNVHNTQPWLWRLDGNRIELYADRRRQLPISDPRGRNLTISCGAALHHAQVVAAASGLPAEVELLPEPGQPDHLATLHLAAGRATLRQLAELAALERRFTDRRRFTAWPVPDERLHHLGASVSTPGVQGVALTDVSERFRVELLVSRAQGQQAADRQVVAERMPWVDHDALDGVQSTDGLVVVCTDSDGPLDWLRAGQALSSLWLEATSMGLSVVPLSQLIEVEETRRALHHEVLGGLVAPQILLRIAWQEIGRSQLRRTSRRPVDDVLLAARDIRGPAA